MEEDKTILSNDELAESGGRINEFFWLCSGVDRKILSQCTI